MIPLFFFDLGVFGFFRIDPGGDDVKDVFFVNGFKYLIGL